MCWKSETPIVFSGGAGDDCRLSLQGLTCPTRSFLLEKSGSNEVKIGDAHFNFPLR